MRRASFSRRIIFGVVPLDTRAWNPLMAPQAMVMNAKGKSFPANTGPEPSMNRVSAGIWRSGRTQRMPRASRTMVPIFMKVER
jgi:hypothetical protein